MPVLYVDQNNIPSLAGSIQQRFEFAPHPDDVPGFEPKIQWDGEHRLRDLLFEDCDDDGIPELVERDFWKESGTVTYYRFTKDKTFVPIWRENWRMGDNSYELLSRERIEE